MLLYTIRYHFSGTHVDGALHAVMQFPQTLLCVFYNKPFSHPLCVSYLREINPIE